MTAEIARALGIEVTATPKSLADISFEEKVGWASARANEHGQHSLTLAVHPVPLLPSPVLAPMS